MHRLNRQNAERTFVERFPEILEIYLSEKEWRDGEFEGLHTMFGDVLNPFLERALLERNKELLKRIFAFLEEMATSDDPYLINVLTVTILAKLGDDSGILDEATQYMGVKTKEASNEIEEYLGRR